MSGDIDIQRLLSQPDCDAQIIIGLPGIDLMLLQEMGSSFAGPFNDAPMNPARSFVFQVHEPWEFYGKWDFFEVLGLTMVFFGGA